MNLCEAYQNPRYSGLTYQNISPWLWVYGSWFCFFLAEYCVQIFIFRILFADFYGLFSKTTCPSLRLCDFKVIFWRISMLRIPLGNSGRKWRVEKTQCSCNFRGNWLYHLSYQLMSPRYLPTLRISYYTIFCFYSRYSLSLCLYKLTGEVGMHCNKNPIYVFPEK
jgi:hypothetical protein